MSIKSIALAFRDVASVVWTKSPYLVILAFALAGILLASSSHVWGAEPRKRVPAGRTKVEQVPTALAATTPINATHHVCDTQVLLKRLIYSQFTRPAGITWRNASRDESICPIRQITFWMKPEPLFEEGDFHYVFHGYQIWIAPPQGHKPAGPYYVMIRSRRA